MENRGSASQTKYRFLPDINNRNQAIMKELYGRERRIQHRWEHDGYFPSPSIQRSGSMAKPSISDRYSRMNSSRKGVKSPVYFPEHDRSITSFKPNI